MVLQGLMEVLQPMTIVLVAIGTVVGIIFGSIPGLTATMAIVMFLPVTYSMTASEGISMLMALYIGGISGGLISAILLNIPGTPSSVATCFDGKPLADKGEAGRALGTGVVFSFVGTIIGIGLLMIPGIRVLRPGDLLPVHGHRPDGPRHAQGIDQRRAGRSAGHRGPGPH